MSNEYNIPTMLVQELRTPSTTCYASTTCITIILKKLQNIAIIAFFKMDKKNISFSFKWP